MEEDDGEFDCNVSGIMGTHSNKARSNKARIDSKNSRECKKEDELDDKKSPQPKVNSPGKVL